VTGVQTCALPILIVSTALGAFTAGSTPAFAVTAVLLAMTTAGVCLALRVGPPGSYFLVLCAGIAHFLAGAHETAPATIAGMTAVGAAVALTVTMAEMLDRKGTRLNSSHVSIAYAVFCWERKSTGREDMEL